MSAAPAPAVALRVLGPLEITRAADGTRVATAPRCAALLAYLALAEPRGTHARDVLVALLWPDADAAHGRRSLRNAVHALRREVGDGVIETVGKHHLRLDRARVRCDLDALDERLAQGDVRGALTGFADLMEGFHVPGAAGFERWHEEVRGALRARILAAARRGAAAQVERAPLEALDLARAARRLDPEDERLLRLELEALGRLGDTAGARRTHAEFAARLALDGAGAPDPETQALLARIVSRGLDTALMTVAFLPVTVDAGDAALAEFARVLEDGVRRRLTRLPGIRVVARSTLAVAGGDATPVDAARACGADLVAIGALASLAGADGIEIALEVVRAADGILVRELRHRARRHDLFAAEGVVAAAIVPPSAGAGPPTALPPPQPPRDTDTYLLCQRGQWHFLRAAHVGGRPEDLERSRVCFEEALARDPASGAAHAGLSNYWAVCAARGIHTPFEATFAHAIALSHRALELDPSLAVPHVHFGVRALYLERDWATARREFAEAVRLDPGYAEAHRFHGIVLRALGEPRDGLAALREAVRLDPDVPHMRNSLADALMAEGALDAAEAELEAALRLDPAFRGALDRLIRCHERAGRFEAAIAARTRLGDHGAAGRFAEAWARDAER
jgi:DNA-binding SARP family transcriptional activator